MSDYIALTINSNAGASLARSAGPHAPVVDDGFTTRPSRRAVRSSFATTLRTAASAQRRWADRIDPACTPARA